MKFLERKNRRVVILTGILVLLVVIAFCMFLPPSRAFRTDRHERELERKLEAIKPPAGVRILRIATHHDQDGVWGTASYTTTTGFEETKAYYAKEFTRNGFVYKSEEAQKLLSVRFCSPDYGAVLNPIMKSDGSPSLSLITMTWKDAKC
ncbi:MAG TPA: hypothetical protein VGH51_14160 [Candidatus Angelobacter sp.]